MKVLVVKTSSLGDVIHTLPALTDAAKAIPDISFDWLVEESFQDIPLLHPNVNRVIPVSVRRWRKNLWKHRADIKASIKELQQETYDAIIDAQGLIKSAFFTHYAKGEKYGLSKTSCREPLAAMAYQHKIDVAKGQHAITRVRQLFAQSLGYDLAADTLSYGLKKDTLLPLESLQKPYLVFLHGTTWASKHWPNEYWKALVLLATEAGFNVYLPWGSESEKVRADSLADMSAKASVLPRSSIKELSAILMHASGVVGVDSGLAHLTAACDTPAVTIYGSTNALLTGTLGKNTESLQTKFNCSPCLKKACDYTGASAVSPACYETLNADDVWQALTGKMEC
ncbi:MAG: lipopolysaccharide heptosyltransferase 1 [Cycloclasticus sp. symbiont of Bathymodiolus heckerae]|nr:MAG: lipopolysaccharide heptosyltransferase 1 [Cycloclasticus sp. symbiont of Bathymodiolus heckerae]